MKLLNYTTQEDKLTLFVKNPKMVTAILLSGFVPIKENEDIYGRSFNPYTENGFIFINSKTGEIFYSSRKKITDLTEGKEEIVKVYETAVQLQLGLVQPTEKLIKSAQSYFVDALPKEIEFKTEGIPTVKEIQSEDAEEIKKADELFNVDEVEEDHEEFLEDDEREDD